MEGTMSLQTLFGVIFGIGGTGAITIAVQAYRRIKTGKLSDDDTLLRRVHGELKRQEDRATKAEDERDKKDREKNYWREKAWKYRLQLLTAGITPNDDDDVADAQPVIEMES